jgi:hypothetical protein
MLELFKYTQENGSKFNQENIQEIAGSFLPIEEVKEDVIKYIINGQTVFSEKAEVTSYINATNS